MLNTILKARVHRLCAQHLEARLMLSVSPVSEDEATLRFDFSHLAHMTEAMPEDSAWVAANSYMQEAFEEVFQEDGHTNQSSDEGDQTQVIPAIPFDDSFSPVSDCPDLDDEFCLPGDASQDGTFDFLDFLLLNQNFGLENATREDGDLNGDGRVAFEDFLLLSAHFGDVA